jgi:hypothetical protein
MATICTPGKKKKKASPPFGRAGAFGMFDGVVPGTAVVAKG